MLMKIEEALWGMGCTKLVWKAFKTYLYLSFLGWLYPKGHRKFIAAVVATQNAWVDMYIEYIGTHMSRGKVPSFRMVRSIHYIIAALSTLEQEGCSATCGDQ